MSEQKMKSQTQSPPPPLINTAGEIPKLPNYLAQWGVLLANFEPSICRDLALMSHQLERLVAVFFSREQYGVDEPDGYVGITQRGPFERLLLSEWLLAEEIPEEFFRRATMNELFYFEPNRTSANINKKIYLLLDSSPMQWGAPRLLHLAMIVVLSRYAMQHKAELNWGFFHASERAWNTGLNQREIIHWQRGSCDHKVSPKHCQLWYQRLCEHEHLNDPKDNATSNEVWVVASQGLSQLLAEQWAGIEVQLIECDIPLEEEHDQSLALSFFRDEQQKKSYLPLPNMKVQTQLLRNPFRADMQLNNAQYQGEESAVALWQSILQFDSVGRYISLRYPYNCLQTFAYLGRAPNQPLVSQVLTNSQDVVGVQLVYKRKCALALQITKQACLLLNIPGVKARTLTTVELINRLPVYHDRLSGNMVLQRKGWHNCFTVNDHIYILDALGTLWCIPEEQPTQALRHHVHDVYLNSQTSTITVLYTHGSTISWELITTDRLQQTSVLKPFPQFHNPSQDPLPAQMKLVVNYNTHHQPEGIAWKCRQNRWGVHTATDYFYVTLDKSMTVIGLYIADSPKEWSTGLLMINHSRNSVFIQQEDQLIKIAEFPQRFVAITYHSASRRLAYLQSSGYLTVFELNKANLKNIHCPADLTDSAVQDNKQYDVQQHYDLHFLISSISDAHAMSVAPTPVEEYLSQHQTLSVIKKLLATLRTIVTLKIQQKESHEQDSVSF